MTTAPPSSLSSSTRGANIFWATIEDEAFVQRVERREAFSKGDTLRCQVRIEQSQEEGEPLTTNYFIEYVGDHLPGPQASLDRWEDDGSAP